MEKTSKILSIILLVIMSIFLIFSVWNESATFDEVAHIPAGYSYITQKDYRLNPEHPPLIKDLSAIPLLFLDLNFPSEISSWKDQFNGQWEFGHYFLYEANKNTDQILFWARFPIILLALFFGWLLFNWTRKNYNNKVGLLTLFFYTMSPTIIAHSRYVTTDLGASFGFFIGLTTFIIFLKNPSWKNILIAGIFLGVGLLVKFSVALLCPLYIILALLWFLLENYNYKKIPWRSCLFWKNLLFLSGRVLVLGIIAIIVVSIVYTFHVWNYPKDMQIQSAQGLAFGKFLVIELSKYKLTQGLGQYLFGMIMTLQRAAGGNNFYFMGTVSSNGTPFYFPILYLLKEPLAFHILTIIILIFTFYNLKGAKEKSFRAIFEWMQDNFAITASIIFIFIYWLQAITSNLNIGLRHILPTLPFIYFLVARQTVRWIKNIDIIEPQGFLQLLKRFYDVYIRSLERFAIVFTILIWIFISDVFAFPYFLSYYNELGGGVWNGYKIATDSNFDWGQDLIRFKKWLDKHPEIQKINFDYFGGGDPKYYLGEKFEPWWSSRGKPEPGSYLAISVNSLQGSIARPVRGFFLKPEDSYFWLKEKKPAYHPVPSILVYKF